MQKPYWHVQVLNVNACAILLRRLGLQVIIRWLITAISEPAGFSVSGSGKLRCSMFGPFGARGTIHEKFRGLARSSALKMERHLCHSAHVDTGCWQSAAGAWPGDQPLLGLDSVRIIARPDHIANTLRKGIIRDCLRLRCARFGDYYESWRN